MKIEMLELLSKRNYSKSDMSHNAKKHETGKPVQSDGPILKNKSYGTVFNRELKDAKEEIEEMNEMILRSWERLGDEKLKKQSAIRRYRIVRSASQELVTHYKKVEDELAAYKCEENGWIERS